MSRNCLSAVAAVLAVSACDAPNAPTGAPQFQSGAAAVGHVAGDGLFNIGAPGADVAFEFNVVLRANGSASGSTDYFTDLTAFGLGIIAIRFDVTCASIDPVLGRAWIGGVVTENNSTNQTFVTDPVRQPGSDVWFRIEDNGNGGSGPLDRSTQLGFEGGGGIITSAEYCATRIWPAAPPHPVTSGNISLR